MDPDDLQPRKKLPDVVLGEDISALSAHELEQRIARLDTPPVDRAGCKRCVVFSERPAVAARVPMSFDARSRAACGAPA